MNQRNPREPLREADGKEIAGALNGKGVRAPKQIGEKVKNSGRQKPHGAGRSSFELIDPDKVFGKLRLEQGSVFLDMACGPGHYAMAAAEIVGQEGFVYAFDLWEEGILSVKKQAAHRGFHNVQAMVVDISKRLPLEEKSIDVCLMATVLHELAIANTAEEAVKEAVRVIGPDGSLAVIEFKKIPGPPGPPLHIRLDPDDVAAIVRRHGFETKAVTDVGPYNYLAIFARRENT